MGIDHVVALDSALDRFLQQEIAIPATARGSASTSQNYLRGVLRNKSNTDTSFPEILTQADCDFLGGSFQRHTKIWPLDDIDLFLPLDGGTLIYMNRGLRLPFTLATDVGYSRLTLDKWKTNGYIDSTKVLNGLQAALKSTYPSSRVEIDRHCVNLQTTVAATAESDGIGFDVVPCFRLQPDDGSEFFYLVPNAQGGWMRSNPRKDAEINVSLHQFHGSSYRKAVRLTKYWNKTQLADTFSSYYIELAISKQFLSFQQQNARKGYICEAFAYAMLSLKNAYATGSLASLITEAPLVEGPTLGVGYQGYLEGDAKNATTAVNQSFVDGQPDAAYATMNTIFGTEFFG